MTKKVIFGAFFHWKSFVHIGSHQYAKQFARHDYKVAYISKPISPLHFFFAKERDVLQERFNEWCKGGKWYEKDRIWAYTPLSLIPVYRRAFLTKECIVKNANRITIPTIGSILKKNDFNNVDILFLDEPEEYLLNLGLHNKSVYRLHDDIRHLKKFPALFKREKKLVEKVDLIITCSKLMESFIGEMKNKKILYLPNAVDFEHFYLGDDTLPEEYKSIPSPRVIYVGSISKWFDIDTLYFSAKKLPEVSFVLIGRARTDLSKLHSLKNVYILGTKDYRVLPQYIKNSSVGIMPFKRNEYIDPVHPVKLYEYNACGLPVVSTYWDELENIKSLGNLASDKKEFLDLIIAALNDKDKGKYIEFARKNSWENRYKKLISSLYPEEA